MADTDPDPADDYGPFNTDTQAKDAAAARGSVSFGPGAGRMEASNLRMLTSACEAAGVTLGTFDERTIRWLAGWRPEFAVSIGGLIVRAARVGGWSTR